MITPDRSLTFPSVEYVRAVISKQGTKQGTAVPVVIDSTHIQAADFTAAKVNLIDIDVENRIDEVCAQRLFSVRSGNKKPNRGLCSARTTLDIP